MMKNTHPVSRALAAAAAGALLAACNSLPERIETLDQARAAVEDLEQDSLTGEVSARRFEAARAALDRAEEAYDEGEDLAIIEDDAYVALRNAQIAQQQIEAYRAREELETAEAERNRVLLVAREREAQSAQQLAEQRAQRLAAQEQALESQQQQLEAQQEATASARERATELEQRAEELEQSLAELEAEQTERGWVLTLEGVLFDFDRAELLPGGQQTVDRIADFLAANPDRNIVIEGHTDSRGDASYNRDLSRQRANAVRQALTARGIDGNRIELRPLGEEYPIASNDSSAGRQLNRRVEIVLSDEGGEFAGRQRSAAAEPQEETD